MPRRLRAALHAPIDNRTRRSLDSGPDPMLHHLIGDAAEVPILKVLLRISDAVLRSDDFDEVLESIAEQAMDAVDAASISVSRWDREGNTLRTLVNVGSLGDGEERWPTDEGYAVAGDPAVTDLLIGGRAYAHCIDDDDCPPESRTLLIALGKECELGVPIVHGDTIWGEIWATGINGRRFDHGDAQILRAIAAYTAAAIGRSEMLDVVSTYAYEDALTGIANRRAVDGWFERADWDGCSPLALMCDLDGFKAVNDRDGHPAGDQLLRQVADVLTRTAAASDETLVARLGGDEFCVLLPDSTLADAQDFANRATRNFRDTVGPEVTMSWGAATADTGLRTGADLLRAADAALIEAKRHGPAHYSAVAPAEGLPAVARGAQRNDGRTDLAALCRTVVDALDENPQMSAVEALEVLAIQMERAVGTCAYALSVVTDDGSAVVTARKVDIICEPDSGLSILTDLGVDGGELADYPETARVIEDCSTFVAAQGDSESDPAEVALLEHLGYGAVLGVGVQGTRQRYLAEFYSNSGKEGLVAISALVRVLAGYCVQGR